MVAGTRIDLVLRLTLVLLILQPVGGLSTRPWILLLAAVGLVLGSALRHPALWFALTLLTALRVIADWPLPDNHAYLLVYWCLAIGIALTLPEPEHALSLNGRLLIGLVFALAAGWKLLSPDYMDGTFFRVTMIREERFAGLAMALGGMSEEMLAVGREYLAGGPFRSDAMVLETAAFRSLASVITWVTVALEAAIAVVFLWPRQDWVSRHRHAVLITFLVLAYAGPTVAGFGWLLVAMGLAQCEPERRITRILYLVAFGLILVYRELPWLSMLAARG
jgi:hypothetical protein